MLQVSLDADSLSAALGRLRPFVGRSGHDPVGSSYRLESFGDSLSIRAVSDVGSAETTIPAEAPQDGAICLPGVELAGLVNVLSGPLSLTERARQRVQVVAGSTRATLAGYDPQDYPFRDVGPGYGRRLLAAAELQAAVEATAYAAGKNVQSVLSGVHIRVDGKLLSLVALDTMRLASTELSSEDGEIAQPWRLTVPAALLRQAVEAFEPSDVIEMLTTGDPEAPSGLLLVSHHTTVEVRTLADAYPDFNRYLRPGHATTAELSSADLLAALRPVEVIQPDRGKQFGATIALTILPGSVVIEAASELGDARTEVAAELDGPSVTMGLDLGYLRQAVAGAGWPTIRLGFEGATGPLFIEACGDDAPTRRAGLSPKRVSFARSEDA